MDSYCSCAVGSDSLWTVALQAPPSMEFLRQEYWSGLLLPPGDLPDSDQTHVSCISYIGRWILKHQRHLGKVKVKVTQSCETLQPHGLYSPWNSPGQNTGVGSLSLLLGIFLTQGSNPGPPHCRQILYQLSHKGSPVIALGTDFLLEVMKTFWKQIVVMVA